MFPHVIVSWPEVEVPGVSFTPSQSMGVWGKQQRWLKGDSNEWQAADLQVPGDLVIASFDMVWVGIVWFDIV